MIVGNKTLFRALSLCMMLSLIGRGDPAAYGQVSSASAYHQILDSLARLDRALCLQAWDQAIGITSELIASPEVSSRYRQELLVFRRQLQRWQLTSVPPTTRINCDRSQSLYLSLPAPEVPEPQSLDWNQALAALNNARSIIDLDDAYDPLLELIPADLMENSPESLANLATPVDTTDGFSVVGGRVNWEPEVYSFLARKGDRLSLDAEITRTSAVKGDFRLLLFDRYGQLLIQSDQSDLQTSVQTYRMPITDVYFAAIVPQETAPILNGQDRIIGWQPSSSGTSFNYTLTLTGVTPYAELLP